MFISCFLEYIDLIFKILQNLLDGSSGVFGAHLFKKNKTTCFLQFWDFQHEDFRKMVWGLSWTTWSILVSPKINKYWFWGSGTRPNTPKSWTWGVFEFSHTDIEKLLIQKWSRIIIRSFLAILLMRFTIKLVPRTPSTPNRISPRFSGSFYRQSAFVRPLGHQWDVSRLA